MAHAETPKTCQKGLKKFFRRPNAARDARESGVIGGSSFCFGDDMTMALWTEAKRISRTRSSIVSSSGIADTDLLEFDRLW